ncbi:MAG: flippase [Thermoplasmata archaeon]|nr:MAG: flippase [Thermoplasmata archaeon]
MIENVPKKGIYALSSRLTFALFGFVYVLLSARVLQKEEYGLLMISLTIFWFASLFSDIGIGNALIKYAAEKEGEEFRKVITNSFFLKIVMSLITSSIIVIISPFLANLLRIPDLVSLLQFLPVLIIVSSINNYFKQVLQSKYEVKKIFYIDSVSLISIILLISCFYYAKILDTAMNVLIVISLSYGIAGFVGFYFSRDLLKFENRLDKAWISKLSHFGKYSVTAGFGSMLYMRIDTLMLSYFISPTTVAIYNAAWVISNITNIILSAVHMIAFPAASKANSLKDRKKLKEIYERSVAYSLLLSIPLSLIFIIFARECLFILYETKYLDAVIVLQILALWGLIKPFGSMSGSIFNGIGRPDMDAKLTWSTAIINIVLNIIFIPIYGVVGAAIASVIAFTIIILVDIYLMKKWINAEVTGILRECCTIVRGHRGRNDYGKDNM